MKVLIVSDTHGSHRGLEEAIHREHPFDMMFHLGDVESGEDYIRALVECEVKIVAGNNDYYAVLPRELEFEVEGTKVFMVHGHTYYIYGGLDKLHQEAKRRGVDVVMYGHLHEPHIEDRGGMTILSPGSIALPRQRGRRPSYMVMNVEAGKKAEYEMKYL